MDKRMIDFIRALRAGGVRVSLAESQDALYGVESVGIQNPAIFKAVMKSTLVKDSKDHEAFDQLFPLFFGSQHPPLFNIPENLSEEERELLEEALRALAEMSDLLQSLLKQMLDGRAFDDDQLREMAERSGLEQSNDMYQKAWFDRRMQRMAQIHNLRELIDQILDELAERGMDQSALDNMREMLINNVEALSDQVSNHTGLMMAKQMAHRPAPDKPDLMDIPFQRLGQNDVDLIRNEIRRLAAKLRSRASLRQKRHKSGQIDLRRTFRSNMRYGGMPLELKYRTRHKKPSLVIICDISTSVRYCTEFLLTLIYELQDQVARADSFVFINDLVDVTMLFKEYEPLEAVERVMKENQSGYYNTDLGNSLNTLKQDHYGLITSKTTVIILGDGRNNYNNPRLDIVQDIQRKARRLLWFCPEPKFQWGTGDSDMQHYAEYTDGVSLVNTLNDLATAVDRILADG
jgi:uncharacterized protein with von Willebrand factor type A (vWA) domain